MDKSLRSCLFSLGRKSLNFKVVRSFSVQAKKNDECAEKPHVSCWNCKSLLQCDKDRFFCTKCSFIQPPVKCVNYFQYLGFGEPKYDLDLTALSAEFRKLQQFLHPDRFSNKSSKEQDYSAQQASLINKAYRTLLEPLPRALYILKLLGTPLHEHHEGESDKKFLGEMMELNESVMETNDLDKVKRIGKEVNEQLKQFQQHFQDALNSQNYKEALEVAIRMKYYFTVKTNVDKKLGFH